MNIRVFKLHTFDCKRVTIKSEIKFWKDSYVDGTEDTEGTRIPFREGNIWNPTINLEEGKIEDWEIGKTANVNYKTVDGNSYEFKMDNGDSICLYNQYVASFLDPKEQGYGDYITLNIDKNGYIDGFQDVDHARTIEILLNDFNINFDELKKEN